MKASRNKYIVKGRIKELNHSTNHKKVRYGSPHFLPLEEICIYNDPRNREYAICQNRISVRGKHRSGMFKAKRTNIRFLENLRLQEIQDPSEKTLEFIERNNILYFEEKSREYYHVMEILDHIHKQDFPKIEKETIDDEQFLKAQAFVIRLQELVTNGDYDEIITNYIKFPLLSHRWENGQKIRCQIDEKFLKENIDKIFTEDTEEQIKLTNINTIYPSEMVMIIGSLRIEISKKNDFKINTIETIQKYQKPNYRT